MKKLLAAVLMLLAVSCAAQVSLDDAHTVPENRTVASNGPGIPSAPTPKRVHPRFIPATRLSFRGITPGLTIEEFKDAVEDWIAKEMDKLGISDRSVYGAVECQTLGRTTECVDQVDSIRAHFLDGKLCSSSWTLEHSDWQLFSEALSKKYGLATLVDRERVQNRMGAKFVGANQTWVRGAVRLRLDEYFGSLDQSWLMIRDSREMLYSKLRPQPLPDI